MHESVCGQCGNRVQGIAVVCPQCGAPMATRHGVDRGRLSRRQRVLVGVAIAAILAIGLTALFYLAFFLYFCLDFTGTGECADEEQKASNLLTLGSLVVVAATGWFGYSLVRWVRRRNRRRAADSHLAARTS